MNYIVAFDLTDPAVKAAADMLLRLLGHRTVVVDINQAEPWPAAAANCFAYLIDHGNGQQFGDYKDPSGLLREMPNLAAVYRNAAQIVLVSCSTANEAATVLANGFQAATFAKNLKAVDPSKVIRAAVGPVFAGPEGLEVEVPNGVIGFASNAGWINY